MAENESALMEEMSGVVTSINNDQTRKTIVERVKKFYLNQKKQLVPWNEFLSRPKVPKTAGEVTQRIMHNVPKFRANYILIASILALYALCTSPILIGIVVLMYAGLTWANDLKEEGPAHIMGREITAQQVSTVSAVGGGIALWLFGATSVIFWMIGASMFVVGGHAALVSIPAPEQLESSA
eukprot:TRINITY_DN21291_c0_g1_i1.p1 TRINITY_DN21291_c0_g1~~TRINITY_DN21291_c0_g1_i1.p1  ORF type:complete len:182 (+),score=34.60 TRINITY_DN21291_c0_g1_i1:66-611(+)